MTTNPTPPATVDGLMALAQECGATVYRHRTMPAEPAVAFGNESWARFAERLAAQVPDAEWMKEAERLADEAIRAFNDWQTCDSDVEADVQELFDYQKTARSALLAHLALRPADKAQQPDTQSHQAQPLAVGTAGSKGRDAAGVALPEAPSNKPVTGA
jgi:hypothetical protein